MKKFMFLLVCLIVLLSPIQSLSTKAASDLRKDPNYQTIYDAMVKLKPEVYVKYNKQVFEVFNKVIEDHPEIFYISHEKTLLWDNGLLEIGYYGSTKTIKSQISKLNKKVDAVYKGSKSKKTTKDKVKYFHDYIIDHTKYDFENYQKGTIPVSSYNAYGTLIKGVAVCEGYAEAMKIFLNKAKIPNYLVIGDAYSFGSWGGHAWNLVKIGSKYYHVDPTWNDPITQDGKQIRRYDYFLINDKKMKKDHRWIAKNYPKAL